MNRLFDDFFSDFGLVPHWGQREAETASAVFRPSVDVSETDKDVTISAELPGMDQKDVTVELDEGSITIRGEKKQEQEDKGKDWYRREMSYGSFNRVVPLPVTVDAEKAKARFKKGVLTVTVPKRPEEQSGRKAVAIETD
jgi:HSP20 family protein